jgi:hypothetical protein
MPPLASGCHKTTTRETHTDQYSYMNSLPLLFDLSETKTNQLLQAPWPTVLQCLSAVPGHEASHRHSLTTVVDWHQAINEDHKLSIIVTAIREGPLGSLTKSELDEKAYFGEWKKEQLVVKDGIVY